MTPASFAVRAAHCLAWAVVLAANPARAQLNYESFPYVVTVFAGSPRNFGTEDGVGSAARFRLPSGLAVDAEGNLLVVDTGNHTLRRITPDGRVTTLAGLTQNPGTRTGPGLRAQFNNPQGVAVDLYQNIYVADTDNHQLRRYSTYANGSPLAPIGPGDLTVLAGDTRYGQYQNGSLAEALFNRPNGIAVYGGNRGIGAHLFVSENTPIIRKITPSVPLADLAPSLATATALAGGANPGTRDGTGAAASFANSPYIAADNAGNVWVADYFSHTIRKVSITGVVTTVAGSPGQPGAVDGAGAAARFRWPTAVAASPAGDVIYVADGGNNLIRRVLPGTGAVTTLAGSPATTGLREGKGSGAGLAAMAGIAVDAAGTLYVSSGEHVIYKAVRGDTTPVYPNTPQIWRQPVSLTVERRGSASFSAETAISPTGLTRYQWNFDGGPIPGANENNLVLPVVETANAGAYTLTVTTDGGSLTSRPAVLTVAQSTMIYSPRFAFSTLSGRAGEGSTDGPVATARFRSPNGVALDREGNLLVIESGNATVRKISPAGIVTTLAGTAGVTGRADGVGRAASFVTPAGIAVDNHGNAFVTDSTANTIRKITPAGVVTTFAGSGSRSVLDGVGTAARFLGPAGIAIDRANNLYVADSAGYTIRKITPAGVVTTLAGDPISGTVDSSHDGTGSAAHFLFPRGLAVDGDGNVFVADTGNHVIRRITPAGVVTTIAGLARNPGNADGFGTEVRFSSPSALAIDGLGNLIVADTGNRTIRRVMQLGLVTTTMGGLRGVGGSDDGTGSYARFGDVTGIAINVAGQGELYVADRSNHLIRYASQATGNEPGPTITTQPAAQSVAFGGSITLQVQATSSTGMLYLWYRDGVPLLGETRPTLTIPAANAGHAGNYHVVITSLFGRTLSATATVTVAAPPAARITNLSILTALAPGEPPFKIGTVLGGSGTRGAKAIVIRAVGPSLAALGVEGSLPDPKLSVFAGSGQDAPLVASNDNWGGTDALNAAMAGVGAFQLAGQASRDAVVAPSLLLGDYVVEIAGADGATGTVLAELYDATPENQRTTATPRLVNVSLLKPLGTGLVAGFTLSGEISGKVLVRAVGPGLAPFGLSGTLANPRLTLYDRAGNEVASNDDWGGGVELGGAFGAVGAFRLEPASLDSALLASLQPGGYTVAVGSDSANRGIVLLEIYEVP